MGIGFKKRRAKQLIPEKILNRIISIPLLQASVICFFLGLIISATYAYVWYDPNIKSVDDITFLMKQGDNIALLFYYILACAAFYIATSMAYRKIFRVDGEGKKLEKELEFPNKGIEGNLGRLNSIAPLFFILLLIIGMISLILGFHIDGEPDILENYWELYIHGILESFFIAFLPATIIFSFMSESRGLKRIRMNMIFLILILIFLITSLIFNLYWYSDQFQFFSDIDHGNYSEAEQSEFALNYARGIADIFELGAFFLCAFIISNLKFRRDRCFRLDLTPGAILFLTGGVMFLIHIIISLTIFNSDFDYSGSIEGYGAWNIFLLFSGRIVMMGGFIVLMVEYSLARKISNGNLCLVPDKMINELSSKNPFWSVFFVKKQECRDY